MFDHVEECEFLTRYCQRQLKGGDAADQADKKKEETAEEKKNNDLEKALQKGSIQPAERKRDDGHFSVNKKGAKKGKAKQATDENNNTIDFNIVKKFGNLKLSVPMKTEEYEKSLKELD